MIFIQVLSIFISWFSCAFADSEGQLKSVLTYHQTADQAMFRGFEQSYTSHRRDLFYPYTGEASTALDWSIRAGARSGQFPSTKFDGYSGAIGMGRKLSEQLYVMGEIGLSQLRDVEEDQSVEAFTYQFKVQKIWWEKIYLEVGTESGLLDHELVIPGGIENLLDADTQTFNVTFWLHPKLRLIGRNTLRFYSDDNRRQIHDWSIMYALSLWPSWIWVGLGGEYTGFGHTTLDYWSPRKNVSYGPRLELSVPLFKSLMATAGINVSRIKEDDFSWGRGHYASVGLQWKDRNDPWNLQLEYIEIESQRESSVWESESLIFSANFAF